MCEPMGRREIFLTFSLLVEIEEHFTKEFVSYVYETKDRKIYKNKYFQCNHILGKEPCLKLFNVKKIRWKKIRLVELRKT
jgi:hypothetical protein